MTKKEKDIKIETGATVGEGRYEVLDEDDSNPVTDLPEKKFLKKNLPGANGRIRTLDLRIVSLEVLQLRYRNTAFSFNAATTLSITTLITMTFSTTLNRTQPST
jgi:hypothetical protein